MGKQRAEKKSEASNAAKRSEDNEQVKSKLREYGETIVIAVVLAIFIRTFIVQAFKIPSGSMKSTLLIGDYLLVNKLAYGIRNPFKNDFLIKWAKPKRGDVIVFKYPYDDERDFIKRVIGLPGERLEIRRKQVYINGEPLEEDYVQFTDGDNIMNPAHYTRDYYGPVTIKPNHLFVMGDNRDNSQDSRFWGQLDMKYVKGKAFILYFSWDNTKKTTLLNIDKTFLVKLPPFSGELRWRRIGRVIQ